MFCPHCGAQNSDGAAVCAVCGLEMSQQPQAPEVEQMPAGPPRTSPMAIWSLVLGILGCFTCITTIPGIILGVLGLKQVKEKPNEFSGSGLATAGIVVSAIAVVVSVILLPAAILFPVFSRAREQARSASCQVNIRQLCTAMAMYSTDYDSRYPPAAKWCDLTTPYTKGRAAYRDLAAPDKECGYGLNSALGGAWESDISDPAGTVIVFESDLGWNANGGPEAMIVKSRHLGDFNIGYADSHVTKIERSAVSSLTWQPTH